MISRAQVTRMSTPPCHWRGLERHLCPGHPDSPTRAAERVPDSRVRDISSPPGSQSPSNGVLSNPKGESNANRGRIAAAGVDIGLMTAENSEGAYILSELASARSAHACFSRKTPLVWGSPPLSERDAQQIKESLSCRSKYSGSTRYPWINVDSLLEFSLDPGSDHDPATEALGSH